MQKAKKKRTMIHHQLEVASLGTGATVVHGFVEVIVGPHDLVLVVDQLGKVCIGLFRLKCFLLILIFC